MFLLKAFEKSRADALKYKEVIFWLGIGLIVNFAFLCVKDIPPICDEGFHIQQISWFLSGNFHTTKELTVLPVYHGILAALFYTFGFKSLSELRMISFLGSSVGIWVFYMLVRRLWPEEKYLRTIQFVFFPILFPFFFLIYTDVWSLLFVLIAVERAHARCVVSSAISIGMAVLIRQPNIFWALFVWLLFLEDIQWNRLNCFQSIKSWLRKTWPFLFIFLGFSVYVLTNGGVSKGDVAHQSAVLNLSNVWFFLLLFPILFLPNSMGLLRRHLSQPARREGLVALTIIAGTIFFWLTYRASHQYNQPTLWFYLRNRLLFWTTHYSGLKLCAGILMCWGAFAFVMTPLAERRLWSLSCITFASIVFLPVIEQRYYLIPMILFLAFRKAEALRWEIFQTIFYVVASFFLLEGIIFRWYFL